MKIPKTDKISKMQLLVTGFAYMLLLFMIIYHLIRYPLNDNTFCTACIITVSLVWVYSFYRNYNRDKYFKK